MIWRTCTTLRLVTFLTAHRSPLFARKCALTLKQLHIRIALNFESLSLDPIAFLGECLHVGRINCDHFPIAIFHVVPLVDQDELVRKLVVNLAQKSHLVPMLVNYFLILRNGPLVIDLLLQSLLAQERTQRATFSSRCDNLVRRRLIQIALLVEKEGHGGRSGREWIIFYQRRYVLMWVVMMLYCIGKV